VLDAIPTNDELHWLAEVRGAELNNSPLRLSTS
jgi:hypothetical protein